MSDVKLRIPTYLQLSLKANACKSTDSLDIISLATESQVCEIRFQKER